MEGCSASLFCEFRVVMCAPFNNKCCLFRKHCVFSEFMWKTGQLRKTTESNVHCGFALLFLKSLREEVKKKVLPDRFLPHVQNLVGLVLVLEPLLWSTDHGKAAILQEAVMAFLLT